MSKRTQQICAFVFGVCFVVVMLGIALLRPNPMPFQYLVFRSVLALAVAGVVAMIPGFLSVQLGSAIRAGGAVGAFIVVFFFSPAGLVATPTPLKEHVGFLSALQGHFDRRVPSTEYFLKVHARGDFDVGRFWIDETTDEEWEGLFKKLCSRYSRCMACVIAPNATTIRFIGDIQESVTAEGVKKLSCKT